MCIRTCADAYVRPDTSCTPYFYRSDFHTISHLIFCILTGQLRHVMDERKLLGTMNSRFVVRLFGDYHTIVHASNMCHYYISYYIINHSSHLIKVDTNLKH